MTILKLRRGILVAFALFSCLNFAATLYAQSGQADVQGVVTDASGSVVVKAQVVLTNKDNGEKRTVTTASDGRYSIPTVAPGHYSLIVTAPTFSPETIDGLVIQLDNHVNQNVTLQTGSAAQSITVQGAVPAVDTTSDDVGGVVEAAQIQDLPIQNRQYLALALLTPGTTQSAERSFYSNVQAGGGLYYYANGFSWDGVSNQQTEEGDPRQNIPEDAVAEYKTITQSMPADLGWAMGGYTAVVSKSGGNKIHGDAFEFFRDTPLTADNAFTRASELAEHTGSPLYRRNQWGGSAGGPLFKDRIHYYGAFERTQATASWTLFEPAGSLAATDFAALLGTFQSPSHDQLLTVRIDGDLTPKQQVFFRYSQEWQLSTANGCGGQNTAYCYDGEFPRKAYVVGHTWEPKPNMVNEARFQYAYISYELGPYNTPIPTKPEQLANPAYSQNVSLAYDFPDLDFGHNYAAVGVESRWQVNDSLTIQKGAHSIKIGADVSYIPYIDSDDLNLNGTYTFTTDQPFDDTAATTSKLSNPYQFTQNAIPQIFYLPSTEQSYFIEDSWKARPNLTINAGLRYDLQRGATFLDTYTPNTTTEPVIPGEGNPHDRGDWHNFGPRVGVSWDPFKKSRDVIRGGYGIYYNFIETELQESEKLNFKNCNISLTTGIAPAGTPPNNILPYPNPYNGLSVANYCSTTPLTVSILSPHLQNPYMHQFTLGYSHQLAPNLSIAADGIYERGLRDYKIYDLNIPANYPANTTRPDPTFYQINQNASTSANEYKAFYIKLDKTLSHHYMYTASYTLASAHDNNPHAAPTNYNNLGEDWGPAQFDQRNALVLSASVVLPWRIQIGGIYQLRSSLPFSVTTSTTSPNVFPVNTNADGTAQYVPGTTRDQGNRGISYAAINAYRADLDANVAPYSTACQSGVAPGSGNCLSTHLGPGSVAPSGGYNDFDLHVSVIAYKHNAMEVKIIGQAFDLFGTQNNTSINTSPTTNSFGIATGAQTVQIGELAAQFNF
jgi:Carboxypeptidase regulatory-like domain